MFHFADEASLSRSPPPIEDFVVLPQCGLDFYVTTELPDPTREAIAALRLSPEGRRSHSDLKTALSVRAGDDRKFQRPSKLLGWPDLLQRDLGEDCGIAYGGWKLLLQMGWWRDGVEAHSCGPGGLVNFILDEPGIVEARFAEAAMEARKT